MAATLNTKENIITSGDNFKLIEYPDFFINSKNKKVSAKNFGEKSALLNAYFLEYLKGYNIPCAFVNKSDKRGLNFLPVDSFAFSVKILNAADARTAKIFSLKPGSLLELSIYEYHFGESKDSAVTESHLISFNLCTYEEIKIINRLCSKINAIVKSFFERRKLSLVELTCLFGKFEGKIYLAGDFSPLSIKLVNEISGELPDPYKIETFAQMKKYSEYLVKLTNGN